MSFTVTEFIAVAVAVGAAVWISSARRKTERKMAVIAAIDDARDTCSSASLMGDLITYRVQMVVHVHQLRHLIRELVRASQMDGTGAVYLWAMSKAHVAALTEHAAAFVTLEGAVCRKLQAENAQECRVLADMLPFDGLDAQTRVGAIATRFVQQSKDVHDQGLLKKQLIQLHEDVAVLSGLEFADLESMKRQTACDIDKLSMLAVDRAAPYFQAADELGRQLSVHRVMLRDACERKRPRCESHAE
jgi:hypothetical protein